MTAQAIRVSSRALGGDDGSSPNGSARTFPSQPKKTNPGMRSIAAVDVPSHKPSGAVPARATVEISPAPGHLTVTIDGEMFVNKPIKFAVIASSKVSVRVGTKSAVIALTRKEAQQVSRLRAISIGGGKIVSPLVTVMAAKLAGLPVSLACAILEQESWGRNEWGHDSPKNGAIFYGGYDQAHNKHYPESPITKAAYDAYRAERGPEIGGRAPHQQGVGPAQLTDAWKQDQADLLGGAWKPLPNMVEGFALLRKSIQRDGLRPTVVAYNGRGPKAEAYADTVLANERQWARALGVKSMQDQHARAPYVDAPQQSVAKKEQTSKHPTQPKKAPAAASASRSTPPPSSSTSPGSSSTSPSGGATAPAVPIEIGSTGVYRVPGTNLEIT